MRQRVRAHFVGAIRLPGRLQSHRREICVRVVLWMRPGFRNIPAMWWGVVGQGRVLREIVRGGRAGKCAVCLRP